MNIGVSVHDGDVKEGAHVSVFGPLNIPAVSSETEITAAEVEDQHPSVDNKAECLEVGSLKPAPNHEGNHGDVDGPNEDTGAELAPEEKAKENPIERPVKESDGEKD